MHVSLFVSLVCVLVNAQHYLYDYHPRFLKIPFSIDQEEGIYRNFNSSARQDDISRLKHNKPMTEQITESAPRRLVEIETDSNTPIKLNDDKNTPKKLLPRFFFNQGAQGFAFQSGGGFRTYLETTIMTKTVYNTTNCIPQSFLVTNPGTCNRRKRNLESYYYFPEETQFSLQIEPTQTQGLVITVGPTLQINDDEPPALLSSKENKDSYKLKRTRRFLFGAGTTKTLTSWSLTTSILARTIQPRISIIAGNTRLCPLTAQIVVIRPPPVPPAPAPPAFIITQQPCLLSCLPPGYKIC